MREYLLNQRYFISNESAYLLRMEMSESQELEKFNARLAECQAQKREAATLSSKLAEVERQLNASRRTLQDAKDTLRRESNDVEALEGYSLTALFYTILGTHEERLEKERQEQLAAVLKHDQAVETVQSLEGQMCELNYQLDVLGDLETNYLRLISDKADYLHRTDNPATARLIEIAEALSDLASQRKELREAVRAGEWAERSLNAVQNSLSSASGWGTADLLGGGLVTTMIKHSRIDTARQHAHTAQRDLLRFQRELADANQRLHVALEIGGFSKFADYFFDGLISDWIVQSKINNASRQCAEMTCAVRAAVRECETRLAKVEAKINHRERERRQLIESV